MATFDGPSGDASTAPARGASLFVYPEKPRPGDRVAIVIPNGGRIRIDGGAKRVFATY